MKETEKAAKKQMQKHQGSTPADLIKEAVAGGADLEKLEKLLSLQERWEGNEARKAYHKAMSEFKANPPKIEKDRKVAYKDVRYAHASLANVCEKINSALSQHGLSASWQTKQDNGSVTVTCKITHTNGHSEQTSLTANPDNTGSKNAIQAIGSTIAYLERYSLLCLTGLATHDMDNDAVGQETISKEEVLKIKNGIKDLGGNIKAKEQKLLKYLKAESIEGISKIDYQKAMAAIKATPKSASATSGQKGSKDKLQEVRAEIIQEGEKKGYKPGETIKKIEEHFTRGYWEMEEEVLLDALNLLKGGQL